jgi:hypothetical protein
MRCCFVVIVVIVDIVDAVECDVEMKGPKKSHGRTADAMLPHFSGEFRIPNNLFRTRDVNIHVLQSFQRLPE